MSQTGTQFESRQEWRPIALSFLTHLTLILLLAFLFRTVGTQAAAGNGQLDRPVDVVLAVNESEETEYLSEEDIESDSADQAPIEQPTSSSVSDPPPLEIEPDDNATPIVPTEVNGLDVNQMAKVPETNGLNRQHELSTEDLKMIAREQKRLKAMQPVGNPASLSVFGTGQLKGRSFVFVVDRSTSMGSGGLGVLDRARTELTNAVNRLEENHSFQVVAYHERTVSIERRQLLAATPSNKQLVPDFIQNLVAFGSTSHENGLTAALVYRPDVIVLITDGGFPELNGGQLDTVKLMARGRTQIHCIQFGSGPRQQTTNFMTRMAEQNNGSFRYIDVNKWLD